ncbi:MAG: transposase family protein [Gammaproteobacteria bacterium]|nr:transposase family protein [Gammaproteobacteria bacterium]
MPKFPGFAAASAARPARSRVPWARPGSGFSQLFEAMVVTLATHMPANTVARLLGIGDDAVWRILHHDVDRARAVEDFSDVTGCGGPVPANRRSL